MLAGRVGIDTLFRCKVQVFFDVLMVLPDSGIRELPFNTEFVESSQSIVCEIFKKQPGGIGVENLVGLVVVFLGLGLKPVLSLDGVEEVAVEAGLLARIRHRLLLGVGQHLRQVFVSERFPGRDGRNFQLLNRLDLLCQLDVECRRSGMPYHAFVGFVPLAFKHMYLGWYEAAGSSVEAYNQIDALLPLLCLVAAESEMVCGHDFQGLSN